MVNSTRCINTAGQMTVVGLMMVFLTLMVMASLMNNIADATTNMSDNLSTKGYQDESVIVKLIPMFMIVVILASIAMYGSPGS